LATTFLAPVQESIHKVEALMRAQADSFDTDLGAALELLISAGGKRIRPALTLLTGGMLNGDLDRLILLSAAIELLHTATLVHDDLIDGALLRRGTPTLNSQWSPGATVLTGDFMFARAAHLAAQTESIEVMKLFSETLAIIVNGEITQLFGQRCQPDRQDYYRRIYAKTGSLFETATTSAAIISEADEHTLAQMRKFGRNIGMAFQIVDDILDFTGEQATVGKPVGSDLRQGLITLPTLCYLETHPDDLDVHRLIDGDCTMDGASLNRLVEAIRRSDAIGLAHKEAFQLVQEGLEALREMPPAPERDALEELADYIVQRRL
jgi:geranylgeranyl pyrophosphate synthase